MIAARVKVGMAFLAIFLLGLAAGAMGLSVYQHRADATRQPIWTVKFNRERYVRELTESVRFRPEQMGVLNTILDDTREEFLALRRRLQPQFEEVKVRARRRIREILTADQQPRFDAFLTQWDEERRAEEEAAARLRASERKP